VAIEATKSTARSWNFPIVTSWLRSQWLSEMDSWSNQKPSRYLQLSSVIIGVKSVNDCWHVIRGYAYVINAFDTLD
jgi:hypothetical protein